MRKENKHDVREQRLDNIDKSTFTVLTANEDSLEPHVFPVVGAVMVSTAMSPCTQTWGLTAYLRYRTQRSGQVAVSRSVFKRLLCVVFAAAQMKLIKRSPAKRAQRS